MKNSFVIFEEYNIRRLYDEKSETWFFSVVDIIQALTQQADFQTARNYWKVLKNRLNKEGSESVTQCNRLELESKTGQKVISKSNFLPPQKPKSVKAIAGGETRRIEAPGKKVRGKGKKDAS